MIISDAIAATFDDRVFPGGLTYSGHPLAMASIVATLDAMADEGIVENAAAIGRDVLGPGLAELAEKNPLVGEVRGLGRVLGRRAGQGPGDARARRRRRSWARIKAGALARGLLPFLADNRVHVVPPCVVTADEAATGLALLTEVLDEVA